MQTCDFSGPPKGESNYEEAMEFDPIVHHNQFCPWVNANVAAAGCSSYGSSTSADAIALCGWQLTLDALDALRSLGNVAIQTVQSESAASLYKVCFDLVCFSIFFMSKLCVLFVCLFVFFFFFFNVHFKIIINVVTGWIYSKVLFKTLSVHIGMIHVTHMSSLCSPKNDVAFKITIGSKSNSGLSQIQL
jgi:hypothetical protein